MTAPDKPEGLIAGGEQVRAKASHNPTPEGQGGGEEHPVFKFLLGEEPLEGRWFGADPPVINGRPRPYWWRKHLREALLSSPRVEEVRRMREALEILAGPAEWSYEEKAVENDSPVTIRCQLGDLRRAWAALSLQVG